MQAWLKGQRCPSRACLHGGGIFFKGNAVEKKKKARNRVVQWAEKNVKGNFYLEPCVFRTCRW